MGEGVRHAGTVPVENVRDEPLKEEAKRVLRVEQNRWKGKKLSWYDWIATFVPFFGWIRTYNIRECLLPDVAAGLSVAAMVVPQGMSYAQNLAFLPQVYGLYGAFTPCIFYALLGSSRQLAVGPVAVTSLILGTGLSNIYGKFAVNPSDPENALIAYKQHQYNVGAIQVAFLAGLFYTCVGLFRLGFVVRILSHPMISGFMSGAALIIASGQVKYLMLQMSLPRADTLQGNLYYVFTPQPNNKVFPPAPFPFQYRQFLIFFGFILGFYLIDWLVGFYNKRVVQKKYGRIPFLYQHLAFLLQVVWSILNIFLVCYVVYYIVPADVTPYKWRETASGGSFLLLLYIIKYVARNVRRLRVLQFLGPLIVCIVSIAIMNGAKLYVVNPDDPNTPLIKPVGNIPKGLPPVTVHYWFPLYEVGSIISLALLICLIDICESVSIAKSLAQKNHYRLDGTQELRGLGIANIAGACFNAYTTTGSFSRSAVNDSVGAKTPLAGMITGFTVMLVLLVLTPVFQNMSANVQGAIIIFGIFPLFNPAEGLHLWHVDKFDWLVWMTGLLITSFAGVEIGILSSVGVSVTLLLIKQFFPVMREVGAEPGTRDFKDPVVYPGATNQSRSAIVIRVDGQISFLNAENVKEYIRERLEKARAANGAGSTHPRFVVLDLSGTPTLDGSALTLLFDFVTELDKNHGATLLLAGPNAEVIRSLRRGGLLDKVGPEHILATVADAVAYAEAQDALPSSKGSATPTEGRSSSEEEAEGGAGAAEKSFKSSGHSGSQLAV